MNTSPDEARRRRALGISVADGMAHAVMLGTVDSFMGAFAVELGHGDANLAVLATAPVFAGALAQLGAARLSVLAGGRKRLVVAGAALQALTHLAFMAIAWTASHALLPLLLAKTAFWVAGSVLAPAWSAWMADLTATGDRARYFAWRSSAIQAALVIAFVGSGRLLATWQDGDDLLGTYALLFAAGLAARSLSTALLAAQYDPAVDAGPERASLGVSTSPTRGSWQVAFYMAALLFAAFIAVPFFTPYMLKDLGLRYDRFAYLTATSVVTKALVFPFCHRIAARLGLRGFLIASGALVAVVPSLWIVAPSFEALLLVEVVAGTAWAGWEYTTFLLLLASTQGAGRVRFLALAGALSGGTQLAGALVGSWILRLPEVDYHTVFALSSALRGASLLLLVPALPSALYRGPVKRIFMRLVSVRPNAGAIQGPIITDQSVRPPPPD